MKPVAISETEGGVTDEGEDCEHPHIEPARRMTAAAFADVFMAANDHDDRVREENATMLARDDRALRSIILFVASL